MRSIAIAFGCVSAVLVAAPSVRAQQFTVQEPSLETFGVGTTVSVPDRGRTSLGGVRRSAAGRAMYGPVRTGHSLGFSDQGTGLSIQARVHDLAELDRAALESADNVRQSRENVRLSPAAEHAYEALRARRAVQDSAIREQGVAGTKKPAERAAATATKAEGPPAEKLLERARQAEADGKSQLALTYLRAARDKGAAPAQREIERLAAKTR
jgi:hypothetical protein